MHQRLKIYCQAKIIKHWWVLKNLYLFVALSWTSIVLLLCLASFKNLPSPNIQNADKYVHFIFHFVFLILWFLYYNLKVSVSIQKKLFTLFFVSLIFGLIIEIVQQKFTVSRTADFYDFLANTSGSLSAVLSIFIFFSFKNKIKK